MIKEYAADFRSALAVFTRGEYNDAANLLCCVVEKWGFPVSAVVPLTRSLLYTNKLREAKTAIKNGMLVHPGSMRLLALCGDISADYEGQKQKAIALYHEALTCSECDLADKGNVDFIRARLAFLYCNTGRTEEGISIINELFHRCPDVLLKKIALLRLDMFRVHEYRKAGSLFQQLFEYDPYCPGVRVELAKTWFSLARHNEAIQLLKDGISQSPHEISLYAALGSFYKDLKQFDDAKRVFLQGLEYNDESNVEINYQLSKIASREGNIDEAAACFARMESIPDGIMLQIIRYASLNNNPDFLDRIQAGKIWKDFLHCLPSNPEMKKLLYPGFEHVPELLSLPGVRFINTSLGYVDKKSPRENFANGGRCVIGAPDDFVRSVYIFGPCTSHDAYDDECTISSQLQKLFNEQKKDHTRIVDKSVGGVDGGAIAQVNIYLKILASNPVGGDVVIVFHNPLVPITEAGCEYYQVLRKMLAQKQVDFFCFLPATIPESGELSVREKILRTALSTLCPEGHTLALKETMLRCGIPFHNLTHLFTRPHDMGEVFTDWGHVNHVGNARIAEFIFTLIDNKEPCACSSSCETQMSVHENELQASAIREMGVFANRRYSQDKALITWIDKAKDGRLSRRESVGAIVMNCNPFTKGHLFLIEQALQYVQGLYVFVVQEDKSAFSFSDRLRLVQEGTRHLKDDIAVVPSGVFIISSFTFPHYFIKDKASISVDTTNDLMIFSALIAPALNITHRFVGEEPICAVTKSYNEQMMYLLPDMGIDVHIIPRTTVDTGLSISASVVRQACEEGDWVTVKAMVPQSTYEYLMAQSQAVDF